MPPKYGPWFPPLEKLYGDRPSDEARELFQGDIFKDVPAARYPDKEPVGDDPVKRTSMGLAIVMGHPCEISPTEKGAAFPWRTLCAVVPDKDARLSLDGEGHFNAFLLPDLLGDGITYYADFRFHTTVHKDRLTPDRRVATLSFEGWQALQRRLVHYQTRIEMAPADIATAALDEAGHPMHPDALVNAKVPRLAGVTPTPPAPDGALLMSPDSAF
jgi:hypothetical protein